MLCEAAECLRYLVERGQRGHWPFRPPAGRLREDDAGIPFAKVVVAESPGFHRPGPEVFDDDVAGFRELEGDIATFGLAQVDADGLFAAIERLEEGGESVLLLPHSPAEVAAGRLLDLDDLGTHIGEHDRGERSLLVTSEVEDADACERRCHGGKSSGKRRQ